MSPDPAPREPRRAPEPTAPTDPDAGVRRPATTSTTPVVIDRLAPISLDELEAVAAMLTRTDRKYLVPLGELDGILAPLAPDLRALEIDDRRAFAYHTVYFDTPDRRSYLDAARRRPRRFKVRTRSYLDDGSCRLEVKLRDGRRRTIKHRRAHDPDDPNVLGEDERAFLSGFEVVAPHVERLIPTLVTRYERSALVTNGAHRSAERATIDVDLQVWIPGTDDHALAAPVAIVETKTAGSPGALDRALWRAGYRPTKVSKYGTSLAALRPELPAHKWRRALDRLYPDTGGGAA